MKELTFENFLTPLQECVLRTLLYYDIFRYPLNADEVYRFLGVKVVDRAAVHVSLSSLRDCGIIFQFGDLFSVNADSAMIERRKRGNVMAKKFSDIARKKAKLISQFPFVRSVMASGSLSKGYTDEKSDIDFFIITVPDRLWIARTLLVLYKRVFLLNSHKYFCVNYFVDERHLEIEEKNLFTATELATVLPLYGSKQYHELHQSNAWLKTFFPNFQLRSTENVPVALASWSKWCLEKIIGSFGDSLERFCHRITLARWKKHYEKSYSPADFDIAFKSRSYASKNHPSNFQRVVMEAYEEKLKAFGINKRAFDENSQLLLHGEGVLQHSTNGA